MPWKDVLLNNLITCSKHYNYKHSLKFIYFLKIIPFSSSWGCLQVLRCHSFWIGNGFLEATYLWLQYEKHCWKKNPASFPFPLTVNTHFSICYWALPYVPALASSGHLLCGPEPSQESSHTGCGSKRVAPWWWREHGSLKHWDTAELAPWGLSLRVRIW